MATRWVTSRRGGASGMENSVIASAITGLAPTVCWASLANALPAAPIFTRRITANQPPVLILLPLMMALRLTTWYHTTKNITKQTEKIIMMAKAITDRGTAVPKGLLMTRKL